MPLQLLLETFFIFIVNSNRPDMMSRAICFLGPKLGRTLNGTKPVVFSATSPKPSYGNCHSALISLKCADISKPLSRMVRCQSTSFQRKNNENEQNVVSMWTHLKEVRESPVPALALGLAGLLPFVSVPIYFASTGVFSPSLYFAQAAYGASIPSFLGGVRWGFSVAGKSPESVNWNDLGYSVTPSLMAWTALLLPSQLCITTVAAGLLFPAYCDVTMCGYPTWFKGLRLLLTFVAVLSLLFTLMCSFFMKQSEESDKKKEKICSD